MDKIRFTGTKERGYHAALWQTAGQPECEVAHGPNGWTATYVAPPPLGSGTCPKVAVSGTFISRHLAAEAGISAYKLAWPKRF